MFLLFSSLHLALSIIIILQQQHKHTDIENNHYHYILLLQERQRHAPIFAKNNLLFFNLDFFIYAWQNQRANNQGGRFVCLCLLHPDLDPASSSPIISSCS